MTRAGAVVKAAHALNQARARIDFNKGASDSVWDALERKENRLLRAVEKLARLKRRSLGVRDSS